MAEHNGSNSDRGPGRPPLEKETVYVQIKLSLRPGRDDDLIDFFNSLPHGSRATAVMAAMRSGNLSAAADPDYVSDDKITDALDALMM